MTFTSIHGGGLLQTISNIPPSSSVTVSTDWSGLAHVYLRLPGAPNTTCAIFAVLATSGQALETTFAASSNGNPPPVPGGPNISPFAPTDVIETVNADGSEDLTWTNNPDNLGPIPSWNLRSDGQWVVVVTVPAGTISYYFNTP